MALTSPQTVSSVSRTLLSGSPPFPRVLPQLGGTYLYNSFQTFLHVVQFSQKSCRRSPGSISGLISLDLTATFWSLKIHILTLLASLRSGKFWRMQRTVSKRSQHISGPSQSLILESPDVRLIFLGRFAQVECEWGKPFSPTLSKWKKNPELVPCADQRLKFFYIFLRLLSIPLVFFPQFLIMFLLQSLPKILMLDLLTLKFIYFFTFFLSF